MTSRPAVGSRADYVRFVPITTRWMDNDVYGHVNNVIYYAFFDTAVNQLLIEAGVLDIEAGPVIGLVIETQCRYASSIAFPDKITAGVRVAQIGNSSVRYEVGLFKNDEDAASGEGHFVHVYVDRQERRPVPIPAEIRAALRQLE
ncbi:MAG: acyl-CoA thioesterase [Caulobacteraceae bacterium]|nr:acyl-CoA thioesterase [Caulobacteraceae bacterium]